MFWLLVLVSAWSTMYGVTAAELQCVPPLCVNITKPDRIWKNQYDFTVEGHAMNIYCLSMKHVMIDCKGSPVLGSRGMPRFTTRVQVSGVVLNSCPMPDVPLLTAFENINITINQNNEATLSLEGHITAETQITELHFDGIDHLTGIAINAPPLQNPTTIYNIVNKYKNLTYLKLNNVPLDIQRIPKTVTQLALIDTAIGPLTEMLKELSFVKSLNFFRVDVNNSLINELDPRDTKNKSSDPKSVPCDSKTKSTDPKFVSCDTKTKSSDTKLEPCDTKTMPESKIEKLWLTYWKEHRLTVLKYCENLRELHLGSPQVENLPDQWVSACILLEKIDIHKAKNLTTLPEKLLAGATRLKMFSISESRLRSIPEGLLHEARSLKNFTIDRSRLQSIPDRFFEKAISLEKVDLSMNEFKTISSSTFSGLSIHSLYLGFNDLDNKALDTMSAMNSLVELDIKQNDNLILYCDENDKSRLSNLTQLRKLKLTISMHYIKHLCSDLKEIAVLESRMIWHKY